MAENVFWAESVVKEIVKKRKKIYVCQGMWTPSGFFHIGNARPELFTPYHVYVTLKEKGFSARQNFIIDDFDAVRKIPPGLGIKKSGEKNFLGIPCASAPSPVDGYKSWADFFVSDVKENIRDFGVNPNIISTFKTYKSGKFNALTKFSLDHSKEIVRVWNRVAGSKKPESFVPVQVVCRDCKRIYFTVVDLWDGKFVHYSCKNCGCKGIVQPKNGLVKLHWRVHWVCHWILFDVSFESGGKDHFSKGGSVEVGATLMREVFKKPPIVQVPTEFIQLKGAKMSGSAGNTINLGGWSEIASPELFRFINFLTRPNKVIEISLSDNNFLLLDERFNRAQRIFYGKEEAESAKIQKQVKRAFKLAGIGPLPQKMPVQISLSFAVLISQLINPEKEMPKVEELLLQTGHLKGKISLEEKSVLKKRLLLARTWVEKYAGDEFKIKFLDELKESVVEKIKSEIIAVFSQVKKLIARAKNAQEIQQGIYAVARENSLQPKSLFASLYMVFLGKEKGPRMGSLVFAVGKDKIIKRLEEII